MQVILLYNPIAGAGQAERVARELGDMLGSAGYDVGVHATRLEPAKGWLDPRLEDAGAMVVVGGDGAVRMASGAAVRSATPLYQFPLGTENLFAREFGMDRSPQRLAAALAARRVARVDVGDAAGQRFLLMASVGFDADVIHDMAARRSGRISHLSYAGPIARQLLRWTPTRIAITIDDEVVVDSERGFVVVANCRQYARRLDPGARADMTDGLLDVVFFPAASRAAVIAWTVRCASGRHVRHPRLVYRTGRAVRIECDPPRRFQLDGDRPEPVRYVARGTDASRDDVIGPLRVTLRPGALPVLLP